MQTYTRITHINQNGGSALALSITYECGTDQGKGHSDGQLEGERRVGGIHDDGSHEHRDFHHDHRDCGKDVPRQRCVRYIPRARPPHGDGDVQGVHHHEDHKRKSRGDEHRVHVVQGRRGAAPVRTVDEVRLRDGPLDNVATVESAPADRGLRGFVRPIVGAAKCVHVAGALGTLKNGERRGKASDGLVRRRDHGASGYRACSDTHKTSRSLRRMGMARARAHTTPRNPSATLQHACLFARSRPPP